MKGYIYTYEYHPTVTARGQYAMYGEGFGEVFATGHFDPLGFGLSYLRSQVGN